MVGSEAHPFVKTGGLADVLGALPQALVRVGHEVAVLLPRYGSVPLEGLELVTPSLTVRLGATVYECAVYRQIREGVHYLFLDRRDLYDRWGGPYGVGNDAFGDNWLRFALLSKAALMVRKFLFRADIVHGHDWQAGLSGAYLSRFGYDPSLLGLKVIYTIHNLGYQGYFGTDVLEQAGLDWPLFQEGGIRFGTGINYMKSGIVYSNAVTTVSPNYAREIQTPEFGFKLDGLLRTHSDKLSGILNGVDYSEWDPATDKHLPANYTAEDLEGKAACKRALLDELGMPDFPMDRPLIGIVSRFADQKGLDLVAGAHRDLLATGAGLVVLGSGDPYLEGYFRGLEQHYRDRVRAWIGYNNRMAHRIEAGADLFLMPSRYEPCGLNQIYSLKYGTVPVVRATGGLDDTVTGETGFKFWRFHGWDLSEAVRVACAEFANRERWTERLKKGMAEDFSWDSVTRDYIALYKRVMELNR